MPKLRQDVVGLITSCVDRKDCKDILTTNVAPACSDEAAASVAPSVLATEVCQSLETAQKKCGVSFDMAACLSRMKLYSEETLGQAKTCSAKACTDVVACVEATLGNLAGYSTGGIELDAGNLASDATVGVPDGGLDVARPQDSAGTDDGPAARDAGSDGGAGPDASMAGFDNTYHVACMPSIFRSGAHGMTLQFRGQLAHKPTTLTLVLQALSANATRLDDLVGTESGPFLGTLDPTNTASVTVGTLVIPGAANPGTGATIRMENLSLRGQMSSQDRFCLKMYGKVTEPVALDLGGVKDYCIFQKYATNTAPVATYTKTDFDACQ